MSKHTQAWDVVTEVMHNRMPSLELVQAVRDQHEDLIQACEWSLFLLKTEGYDSNFIDNLENILKKAKGV